MKFSTFIPQSARATFLALLLLNIPAKTQAFFWNWIITNPNEAEESEIIANDDPGSFGTSRTESSTISSRNLNGFHPRNVGGQSSSATTYSDAHVDFACRQDAGCPIGNYCDMHYRLCKSKRNEGSQCRMDSHCNVGLHCMFGLCLPEPKPGHKGSRCHSSSDCIAGHCCARQHGERVCKPNLAEGQRCYVPDGGLAYSLNEKCPCDDGLVCGRKLTTEEARQPLASIMWTSRDRLRCIR